MSWAETKKINSDLSTPLNVKDAIDKASMFGTTFSSFNNLDLLSQVFNSAYLPTQDTALDILADSFYDVLTGFPSGESLGTWLDTAFKIDSVELRSRSTLAELLTSTPEVFFRLGANASFGAMCIRNYRVLDVMKAEQGLMHGILYNPTAVKAMPSKMAKNNMLATTIRNASVLRSELFSSQHRLVAEASGSHSFPANASSLAFALLIQGGEGGGSGRLSGHRMANAGAIYALYCGTGGSRVTFVGQGGAGGAVNSAIGAVGSVSTIDTFGGTLLADSTFAPLPKEPDPAGLGGSYAGFSGFSGYGGGNAARGTSTVSRTTPTGSALLGTGGAGPAAGGPASNRGSGDSGCGYGGGGSGGGQDYAGARGGHGVVAYLFGIPFENLTF